MPVKNESKIVLTAEDRTSKAFKSAQGATAKLSGVISKMAGPIGIAAAAAGAAALAFGALGKKSFDAAVEMQKNAAMAGVSAKAFQELQFAADRYNVTQEGLTDGMKELALRGDEFAKTGKGSAAEAFQRLGLGAAEVKAGLKDTPELLAKVADRMQGLGKAAQIRIADELFGGQGGEQFVQMLEAGGDGIRKLRKEAAGLGHVMSDVDVKKITMANDSWKKFGTALSGVGNKIAVAFAPALKMMADWLVKIVANSNWLGKALQGLADFTVFAVGKMADAWLLLRKANDTIKFGFMTMANVIIQRMAAINVAMAEFVSKIPGIDIAPSARLAEWAKAAHAAVDAAREALVKLLVEPPPSEAIMRTFQAVTAAAEKTTAAVVNARIAMHLQTQTADEIAAAAMFEGMDEIHGEVTAREMALAEDVNRIRDRQTRREAASQRQNVALWKSGMQGKLAVTSNMMGQLSVLMNSESKKQFEIGKAAAIGEAVVGTFLSAQKAYTAMSGIWPAPLWGVIAAAAATASGLINIKKIKSAKFGGGASAGGGGGGRPSIPSGGGGGSAPPPVANVPALQPAQRQAAPRTLNLTLVGGTFTDQQIREELIPGLQEALDDGMTLNVRSAA